MHTVGSVPFVNAKPLIACFEHLGHDSPVKVLFDVPSKLPTLLESGAAQAVMVSSIDALATPGRRFAEGVCIGSRGPAESVRLFSKVSFDRIETLALDQSSMTSNALARIILAEKFGVRPGCDSQPPDLIAMIRGHDATVLIGDKGLLADGDGLHVLDLGSAWLELTGLPFVWALWTGGEGLTEELSWHLNAALDWGLEHMEDVIAGVIRSAGWEPAMARQYLAQTMNYRLETDDQAGLRKFGELCVRHGLIERAATPEQVSPSKPIVHA